MFAHWSVMRERSINHDYNKILKFDWLSIVLISALVLAERVDNFVTRIARGSREDRKQGAISLWSLIFLSVWYRQLPSNKP